MTHVSYLSVPANQLGSHSLSVHTTQCAGAEVDRLEISIKGLTPFLRVFTTTMSHQVRCWERFFEFPVCKETGLGGLRWFPWKSLSIRICKVIVNHLNQFFFTNGELKKTIEIFQGGFEFLIWIWHKFSIPWTRIYLQNL
jgi:hypothetical protein